MDLGGTRLRPRSTGRRESHILYWSCHFDLIEATKWFVTTLCNLCNCDCNRQLTTIIIVLFSTALLLCKSLFLVLVVEVKKGNQKVVEVKKKGNKKSGWGHSYSPKWDKWHSGHTVWGLVDVYWALSVLTVSVHFNEPNNRPTKLHSVWFSTDAITLAIVATQLSGSGHTIQIHSTPSALDHQLMATNWGHQVAAVDTWSCRYKRANMKDGTCVHTARSAMCTCVWERVHRWVGVPATQVVHRPRVDKQIRPQSLESQFTENSSTLPYSPTKGCVLCLLGEISRLQQFHFTYVHRVDDEHWTLNASLVPLLSNPHDSDRNWSFS